MSDSNSELLSALADLLSQAQDDDRRPLEAEEQQAESVKPEDFKDRLIACEKEVNAL